MAAMIIASEKLQMPVWLKARLLVPTIETTNDANVLTVESGTDRNKRHSVTHDGQNALSCSCPAVGDCAHKQAVTKYLSEQVGEMEAAAMAIIAEEQTRKALANFFAFLAEYGHEQRRLYWQREGEKAANTAAWGKMEAKAAVAAAEAHLAEQRRNKIKSFSFMR